MTNGFYMTIFCKDLTREDKVFAFSCWLSKIQFIFTLCIYEFIKFG
jgi:hypothetical protein